MKITNKEERINIWNKIKIDNDCKTTEELFGLNDPIGYQCSFVDEIKNKVGNIELAAEVKRKDQDDLEILSDKLYEIRHDVYGLEDDIEKMRDRIVEVREWGSQWKELCKKIILKYEIDVTEI